MTTDFQQLKSGKKIFTHDLLEFPEMDCVTSEDGYRYYADRLTGERFDSVTTTLKWRSREAIQAWEQRVGAEEAERIRIKASERGDVVHDLAYHYLNNDHDRVEQVRKSERENYSKFRRLKRILNRIDNIRALENTMLSRIYALEGTADCIGDFDRVPSIIDFKTSNKYKRRDWITSYFLQATAYSLMLEEMHGLKYEHLVVIIYVENDMPIVYTGWRSEFESEFLDNLDTYRKLKSEGKA